MKINWLLFVLLIASSLPPLWVLFATSETAPEKDIRVDKEVAYWGEWIAGRLTSILTPDT